ncbi:MAG: glycosyltransferase family 2 protein [Candidatus Roizmanbacteria bacterium]|nr:MAG: glycosyltransferase family 2 protein [Candidatus Roizmanbacteria bacterium]
MKDLSIVILSYNTKEITSQCIKSLVKSLTSAVLGVEILVIDNASIDGSVEMLQHLAKKYLTKSDKFLFKPIFFKDNFGYSKANNKSLLHSTGKYLLFLNSDVIVDNVNFDVLMEYMNSSSEVGGLTVRVNLPNGQIDPASHRGFPTLWRSLCYFSGLEKLSAKLPIANKLFGGYHLLSYSLNIPHEIDSPSGAFFLIRREIFEKLKGFDEEFFMYGEDLDLSFRIKELGYKIKYEPSYCVTHLKYRSGLSNDNDAIRNKIQEHFYEAMKIFYKKHYEKKYPVPINSLIYFLINLKKHFS